MAHVCLKADQCRIFIKNGQLRFQARRLDDDENVEEQVTITFPKEMACWFNQVENLDEPEELDQPLNRIKDLLSES